MPSFGAIKQLQARCPGVPRSTAKKALEEHEEDEDAAAKFISETTEFKDTKEPPKATGVDLSALSIEEGGANTTVSVLNIEVGDGETFPVYGDTLFVDYVGKLTSDGTVFDSSFSRGKPFDFRIGMGKVIKGWDEAIMKMSVGEKAMIMVPACKAYGAAGSPPAVPPDADLTFEVTLVRIQRQTSCLGPGQHGGVQRKNHEYAQLADQLLGRAPQTGLEQRLPDEREPMPLTKDMPS